MYKFGFLKKLLIFFTYMVFYRIIMPHKKKHLCVCNFLRVCSPTELLKSHIDVAPGTWFSAGLGSAGSTHLIILN